MANFFKDNEDLRFYLEHGIDWAPLVEELELGFKNEDGHKNLAEAVTFYRELLETIGEFAAEEVAPRAAEMDREGLTLENGDVVFNKPMETIFKKLKKLGVHGLCLPRELGGMNAPGTLYFIMSELFARGDVSCAAHLGFHSGVAVTMLLTSLAEGSTEFDTQTGLITKTRFAEAIAEIVEGKAWGAMDLTEPNAGSDLAAIRTRAEQDEAGQWRITGQKIFLTSGNGKYHFVLARSETASSPDDPKAGLGGLSLFLVRLYEEKGKKKTFNGVIERLEEKIGHHSSPTVAVSFDNTPGELVGKRGEGFRLMLMLMNHARMGVCYEGLGVCEAAYRMAKEYAEQRPSMGKMIARHELIADALDEMDTELRGLRAMAMYGCIEEDLAQVHEKARHYLCEPGSEAHRRHDRLARLHKANARRVTPLCKYLGSELAVSFSRRAIQILGGVGYTREYGAEKLLRDSLVLPIYEGTSQIQSLMAMKDTLGGIFKNPQAFIAKVAQTRWRSFSARDPLERRVAKLQALSMSTQQFLVQRVAKEKLKALSGKPIGSWPKVILSHWDPKRDFAFALLQAENLLRILADEAVVEQLLAQAKRFPERRALLEDYLERAEPRCRFWQDKILTTGERLLTKLAEADAPEADEQVTA